MAAAGGEFQTPYTPYPGSSTPSPDVSPEEGKADLWTFFWLALANTGIIAAAGIIAWIYVR